MADEAEDGTTVGGKRRGAAKAARPRAGAARAEKPGGAARAGKAGGAAAGGAAKAEKAARAGKATRAAAAAAPAPAPEAPPPAEAAALAAAGGGTLRKKDLLARVAAATGSRPGPVREIVEATLAVLGEALGRGDALNLPPLGRAKVTRQRDHGGAELIILRLRRPAAGPARPDGPDPAAPPEPAPPDA